ncbi:MAG: hypothetical protein ABF913_04785 [Oenococcus sp.]|uniref:hypothetical protein n=1 Tax=Oenococcus sp. TaxID=1979414 RepID=UPI0039E814A1
MAYLTFAEYQTITNKYGKVTAEAFDQLEYYAELALDRRTFNFYQLNDLASDQATFRVAAFKKAMTLQIEYLNSQSVKTQSDVDQNNSLTSQNIGGISLSLSPNNQVSSVIPSEVIGVLESTGLLFRGVQ